MKKILLPLFFIILAALAAAPPLSAKDAAQRDKEYAEYRAKLNEFKAKLAKGVFPEILHPVNDYANILSPAEEETIATMLVDHGKKTGVQIAVLTVNSTDPLSIEEFSIKTAEKWGGGSRERDDGLLFTVAVDDHRMRIEAGYGLEGYITDLKAGRILGGIRDDFKKYAYGQGIEKVVSEIISATDELRPGQGVPASVRLWGAFAHITDYYIIFFIVGALAAVLLILGKMRFKFNLFVTILAALVFFVGIPVLFQLFLNGIVYWILYLVGAVAGAEIMVAIIYPVKKKNKILATVLMSIPVLVNVISIVYFLQIVKLSAERASNNDQIFSTILIITNIIQVVIMRVVTPGSTGYYVGSGSGYSSSSGSSSSNSSSWSGGGGGFGGGGASSSW